MAEITNTVCFTCGLGIEDPPRLNRLTTGQVCPACRERLLDALPPMLPAPEPAPTSIVTEPVSERLEPRDEWAWDEDERQPG